MPLAAFHPVVRRWFEDTLGAPTTPQVEGWPAIRGGGHTLIAAPTGSGKTLAAFLWAVDGLLREGAALPDETRVLYVSPLKALGNDIRKNLLGPLAELRARDASFPDVRVLVRSGDTPAKERAAMAARPPHILVTTPESLYILLTSDGGRRMLSTVRTVIVDEIHAVAGDKRGAHLSLSLERLVTLAGNIQRIGLSATQKPIDDIARFLAGAGRECRVVDAGHLRHLDLGIELPSSPLSAVCSHETWSEIYERMAALIREHRTTLVFVNTRKMAERIAAQLTRLVGEDHVACHHGSLSRERRLAAEQRLKEGRLRALVATASLELGIDIGEVDLVLQTGGTRSIATFLQRVGRAGHGVGRVPKGRIFPLTRDELVEAAAILESVRRGELDRIPQPEKPVDILAQQIVAACVPEARDEEELFRSFRSAWPYREMERGDFDGAVALHSEGRYALLHRDGVNGRLRGTRRARITAVTSGGAIPDVADYRVLLEPSETFLGTLNEDFAIESSAGDVFQLGNASWRILRIERGTVRVADAQGAPPTIPFWLGEAPGRTTELADSVSRLRERIDAMAGGPPTDAASVAAGGPDSDPGVALGVPSAAADQMMEYVREGRRVLGATPTRRRVILERFFDESGGMQLVVHAPFGSRITRAWGLALRKRFCRHFGFELQAAANEEAIVLSLGPQHSFPLADVFDYLHPNSAREVLVQALLATPMFQTRWRWNLGRALVLPRWERGRRLPAPIARMRADDLLVQAFPEVLACPENLPPGDFPVPMDHPLVRQTVEDCLNEAMDVDGFLDVLRGIRSGAIETHAVDTPEPSAFAHGILNASPYAFLDDAPLEERRTQAVMQRRALDPKTADELGALDPAAVARVKEEAWPQPRDAEEVHEALLWMGWLDDREADAWRGWIDGLAAAGRVVREGGRWMAAESTRDPKEMLRGRLEAVGPVFSDAIGDGNGRGTAGGATIGGEDVDALLAKLETEGRVLRCRLDGRQAWCDRRLLARIHRATLDALRKEIEPVSAADFLRFLARWQHADAESLLDGPRGVAAVLAQLAGFEAPAVAWEKSILPARIRGYRRDWLDECVLSGEAAWGRLWGQGAGAVRTTPICFVRREDLDGWLALAGPPETSGLSAYGRAIHAALASRGALFTRDLERAAALLPEHFEAGLAELLGHGLLTNDSFRGLRQLLAPPSRRRSRVMGEGRWSTFRMEGLAPPETEWIARRLLNRWGVVFRTVLLRERIPVAWRDLVRCYRLLELKGDVRGGRFVGGFAGEQYALPGAVDLLRRMRRSAGAEDAERLPLTVAAADPLNLRGILTPDARVSPLTRGDVVVG